MTLPLSIGAIVGGLGFPALFEAFREWRRPARWAVATKLTVWGSVALLVAGFLGLLAVEWANPRTLGTYAAAGQAAGRVSPRSRSAAPAASMS